MDGPTPAAVARGVGSGDGRRSPSHAAAQPALLDLRLTPSTRWKRRVRGHGAQVPAQGGAPRSRRVARARPAPRRRPARRVHPPRQALRRASACRPTASTSTRSSRSSTPHPALLQHPSSTTAPPRRSAARATAPPAGRRRAAPWPDASRNLARRRSRRRMAQAVRRADPPRSGARGALRGPPPRRARARDVATRAWESRRVRARRRASRCHGLGPRASRSVPRAPAPGAGLVRRDVGGGARLHGRALRQ